MPKEPSPLKTSPDARINRRPVYETTRRRSREPERHSGSSRHSSTSSPHSARNFSGDSIKGGGRLHNGRVNGRRHAEDGAITVASRRSGHADDAMVVCETSRDDDSMRKWRETYTRHLLLKRRGFPLLQPRTDIALGDVGSFTPTGGFEIFFNVLQPPEHPKNRGRVPPGFAPFTLSEAPKIEERRANFLTSADLTGTDDGRDGWVFRADTSPDGAVIAAPGGLVNEDLNLEADLPGLRAYVAANLEAWYQTIPQARNGELRVVIGVDKAKAPWGVAVFRDVSQGTKFRFSRESNAWQGSSSGYFREGKCAAGVYVRTLNPRLNDKVWKGAKALASPDVPHLSDVVNTRVQSWPPAAEMKVVISEDHNWCSILSSKDRIPPPPADVWARVIACYRPIKSDNFLFLQRIPDPPAVLYAPITDETVLECFPVERPRRGKRSEKQRTQAHNRVYDEARRLKNSGFARYAAQLSPLDKTHKPLLPGMEPKGDTPYAVHPALFGRLEMLESVLGFVYSRWIVDEDRKPTFEKDWEDMRVFINWCRSNWLRPAYSYGDAEKAFLGLINMLESFILAKLTHHRIMEKKVAEQVAQLHADLCQSLQEGTPRETASLSGLSPGAATPAESAPTPTNEDTAPRSHSIPHLPPRPPPPTSNHSTPTKTNVTPTRIAQAQSLEVPRSKLNSSVSPSPTTSTPRSMSDDPTFKSPSKPNGAPCPTPIQDILRELQTPEMDVRVSNDLLAAMHAVKHPTYGAVLLDMRFVSKKYTEAQETSNTARETLSLPVLRRWFPKTWRRVVFTSLAMGDEHEPEFEDDAGELYWPDHPMNGQGIGWVCLMGKAMLKEFGTACGYKGLEGTLAISK